MAMTNCVECGKEISSTAKACPHCGKQSPTVTTQAKLIALAIAVLLVLWICNPFASKNKEGQPSTSQSQSPESSLPLASKNNDGQPPASQSRPVESFLPHHRINDLVENDHRVMLFLVVDSDLSDLQAMELAQFYRNKYSNKVQYLNFPFLMIEMHCDALYATDRALMDKSISETEYNSHLLYTFSITREKIETWSPTKPIHPAQGKACGRRK